MSEGEDEGGLSLNFERKSAGPFWDSLQVNPLIFERVATYIQYRVVVFDEFFGEEIGSSLFSICVI